MMNNSLRRDSAHVRRNHYEWVLITTAAIAAQGACLLLACVMAPLPARAQATPNRSNLARDLMSESVPLKGAALMAIQQIPASKRGQLIRSAVRQELRREYEDLRERRTAREAGRPMPVAAHDSSVLALLKVMIEYEDQADFESLVLFVDLGHPVQEAISAFGEVAVRPLVALLNSNETYPSRVGGALRTLTRITELHDARLSQVNNQRILAVARKGLYEERGGLETLLPAIDLPLATRDPELRAGVESLVNEPSVVRSRGVPDEGGFVEYVHKYARDGLAKSRR